MLRRTRTLLSVSFAHMLEYRAELFLWMLASVMPFIMMGLWVSASSDESANYALGPLEFARYFIAMFIVRQLTMIWVIWDFEWHVVEGRLSPYLLQPMDPVWRFIAGHVAERGARGPFVLVLLVLFFVLYPDAWWVPALRDVGLCVLAVVLAFLLRFMMQYTMAMGCFWVERASGMEAMTFALYMFLSGMVAPLEIFPPSVREIAMWTPFPYLVYFPSTLLVDSAGAAAGGLDIARGFAVLTGWLVVFTLLNRWLWRMGLKHYSAMGA